MKVRLSCFAASFLGLCLVSRISGSAIPIWEYLTRDEKMSHLYKIFSQQVEKYCSRSSMPDCNKNFLVTGMQRLASISNDRLDLLDPYQRDSEDMIWRALAGGSRRNNEQEVDDRYSGTPDYTESDNGLAEESAPVADYIRPENHSDPVLVGPMVFRVMPDGRPVPGDRQGPLPKDEDIDELKFPRLPSIEEIEAKTNSRFYQKPEQPSNNALVSSVHERRPQPSYRLYIRGHPYFYPLRESIRPAIPRGVHYY